VGEILTMFPRGLPGEELNAAKNEPALKKV
jgi:hypothetical protein